jgi:hypothetical protein
MGMTKALMEKNVIARSRQLRAEDTILCLTRYGNVMGSRGSVIPLFLSQIEQNIPITITNPEMTRFMMSLEEAVELFIYGFDNEHHPEIHVLKDGESHGAGQRMAAEHIGFPLIAFQHWLTREPTTIASMWKGPTVGPLQEALIKRFNPDAYVVDGYADTTRNQVT